MDKKKILRSIRDLANQELNRKVFVPGVSPVYASGAVLFPEDIEELTDTILQFWYTDWKKCASFKRKLCEVVGKKHCVLTNSGSSASLIAVTALLNKSKKNKVITTAVGFPTTIYPVYQNNSTPIFIDVKWETFSPNWSQFIDAYCSYDDSVAGVIFAHTLGFPFNEVWLKDFKEENRGFVIVDCCDALGAKIFEDENNDVFYNAGKFSDAMTLSFFPAHHITSAEGGAILTDDEELALEMEKLVNWGRDCYCLPGQSNTCGKRFEQDFPNLPEGWDHKYTFTRLGYNLKMTEFQAALGLSQLNHLEDFVIQRVKNFNYLLGNLCKYLRLEFLNFISIPEFSVPSPFGFPVFVNPNAGFKTKDLIDYLEKRKIHTRRIFGGNLIRQPFMEGLKFDAVGDLKDSNYVMENGFWIGCWPGLTTAHLDYVLEVFEEFFKNKENKNE